MKPIDLRSDTVTQPGDAMRQAMLTAAVGDDVYGEDPTVNALETFAADLLGKEAALFCSSGTQSNLLAILTHCGRGDEYIVGQTAHTYRYEGGGAAVLGSIQPQPLDFEPDGTLNLSKVAGFVKPDDYHFAKTRLLCLENTQRGKVLPLAYLDDARTVADTHCLGLHLDGARIFNAAVRLNVDVRQITQPFDTVSCCLSKGLGAPVGSVLAGPRDQIREARRWRKMLGGGMRQAGMIAAAGIYALTRNIDRLAQDHENAQILAAGLSDIEGVQADPAAVQTNIVFARFDADMDQLAGDLKAQGIRIDTANPLRLVTHLDVSKTDIESFLFAVKTFFNSHR